MNISWLTLRDLEYLVAVADHRHFGKAAEACHVSQPALSAQIKKVESLLEMEIFERDNRTVVIAPDGAPIVEQARVVLEEARKIAEIARGSRETLSGRFRLGSIATLGPYYVPHFIGPLKRAFPKIELLLREGLTESLLGELRDGKLDAVLASPPLADDGLRVIPLFVEPFVLAMPKGHPHSKSKSLRTADLRGDEMVLLEEGHCLKDQALETCPTRARGQRERVFQATSLETLRHLVAAGMGYTLIPAMAVREDRKLKGLLEYRAFDGKPVGRSIALVCRNRYSKMSDIDALAAFLKEKLPDVALKTGHES